MTRAFTRLAFTDAVREAQRQNNARANGERLEAHPAANDALTPDLMRYIEQRDSFFIATANQDGWPYVQHRGGLPGFLKALDPRTLGFADFSGNRQYLTVGNLADNDRVHLFLMDWAHQRRLKIWGRATIVTTPEFLAAVALPDYPARVERAIRITIEAYDLNCNQHIPRRFSERELAPSLARLGQRIATLEAGLAAAGLEIPDWDEGAPAQ